MSDALQNTLNSTTFYTMYFFKINRIIKPKVTTKI